MSQHRLKRISAHYQEFQFKPTIEIHVCLALAISFAVDGLVSTENAENGKNLKVGH